MSWSNGASARIPFMQMISHERRRSAWLTLGALALANLLFAQETSAYKLAPSGENSRRFEDVFGHFQTEWASLSPDGKHLAYSILDQKELAIVVVSVDEPGKILTRVVVSTIEAAQPPKAPPFKRTEPLPLSLEMLTWTSNERVIAITFLPKAGGRNILGFDKDGKNGRVLATSRDPAIWGRYNFFSRTREPGTVLLRMRSRSGRLPGVAPDYAYLRLDTVTGKTHGIKPALAIEEARVMRQGEYATHRDWPAIIREVQNVAPDKRVTVLENDTEVRRFLALVEGMADPGSFCVIDLDRRVMLDLVRRMPNFDRARAPLTTTFEFTAADGQKISGELSLPPAPKVKHAPLVVIMPDKPGEKVEHGFSREAQAFADMGLASVRFDSFVDETAPEKSTREREHRLVDEVMRLVDSLPGLHAVSKRSVVLYGESDAGYLALRAMQIYPDRFIAAVVVNPKISQQNWYSRATWPENAGKPGPNSGIRRPIIALASHLTPIPDYDSARRMRILRQVVDNARNAGAAGSFIELPLDMIWRLPRARALAFREIEDFLNPVVYDYQVKLGDLQFLP